MFPSLANALTGPAARKMYASLADDLDQHAFGPAAVEFAVENLFPGAEIQVNTMPVLSLPFSILLYRERVSFRAAAGAIVTVIGVGLMCWGT
jgi:hypothetical protein